MTVILDGRWDGNYGIGRVGREVGGRLRFGDVYRSRFDPLSAAGIAQLRRFLGQRRGDTFWSPGFTGTFPTHSTCQVLTIWDLAHLRKPHRSASRIAYYNLVVKPAVLQCGLVMTGTASGADDIREWLGQRRSSPEVIPIGCGVSPVFRPQPIERIERHFVLVGNTHPHKNTEVALRAVGAIDGATATWVVSDRLAAARYLRNLGGGSKIEVVSGLKDSALATLYASSTALIFPSVSEGFGLPPIEAAACGTPVVYYRGCDAVHETSGGDPANIAVDSPTEVQDWVDAIASAIGARRVPLFPSRYSWDAVATRVSRGLNCALH